MFKKITLLFFLAMALNARAQFSIDEDTLHAYAYAGKDSNDFVDIYGHTVIRNLKSGSQTILWNRIVNNLPDTQWSSAICDIISCRGPEVSSDSFTFAASGDTGILSFHFYAKHIRGNGSMTVRFSSSDNPLDYMDVVVMAQAWGLGLNKTNAYPNTLYPNPASDKTVIENAAIGNGVVLVYNEMGKLISEQKFEQSAVLDLSNLGSGVYSVLVKGEHGTSVSRLIRQ